MGFQKTRMPVFAGRILLWILLTLLSASCAGLSGASGSSGTPGRGEAIPPSVREFLDRVDWRLEDCRPSSLAHPEEFTALSRYYWTSVSAGELWDLYTTMDAARAWQGEAVQFGVVYDSRESRLYTPDDSEAPPFREGQIYVLDLTIAGFYKLPVGFLLSRLDPREELIEFLYLLENRSNGGQQIRFFPFRDSRGREGTLIEHRTWFHSSSAVRDRLYPLFHNQTIDAFHRNITSVGGLELEVMDN